MFLRVPWRPWWFKIFIGSIVKLHHYLVIKELAARVNRLYNDTPSAQSL
jgi:hypothetical protein